ncbi:MAG: proteasome accessory factor PafA2 family protein, partial [Janthinobacterium lividum]
DFFTEEASVDTLHRRPLVNTRDEPHADPRLWRRLHVICGDANMSEYATALKIGTTYLVTSLLEQGWQPWVRLKQPAEAIKQVSRDQSHKWQVEAETGTISAVDIQRVYLAAAKEKLAGRGFDTDWTLTEWERTLDALETDPLSLSDRIDWVAKRSLLADYVESEGVAWNDETLPSFDLAYSNVDPDEGLYYALEQAGEMVRLTNDRIVETAQTEPPANTRAAIRGYLVDKFSDSIGVLGWNKVVLRTETESWVADLDDYLTPTSVADAMATIKSADSLEDLVRHFRESGK